MYKLDEQRPCKECGKRLVYTRSGWFHIRKPRQPHTAAPVEDMPATLAAAPAEDMSALPEKLQRLAELEEIVKVQAARMAAS